MGYKDPMLVPGALAEKVVLVTGGGTGLGRSMAEYFLSLGAKVIIASRRREALEQAAEEMMRAQGGSVLPLACDIRVYEQVEAMIEAGYQAFGTIDALVNNAAGNFVSPTERLSVNAFDAVIDIVLKGTRNCTLALGKRWIQNQERDRVVLNIVTTYAWTGSPFVVPSAMAKAGVLAMTRSLAVEWAKYGMRHNAVAPGPFPTAGAWDRLMPGDIPQRLNVIEQIPLRRSGEHQELANLAAYMVSDFSAFMNGEVVTIDGGEWLQDAGQLSFLDKLTSEEWDWMEQQIKGARRS
ncbi:SDR family oxidoreductase [bacterium]|nr:SDR family oxidoreductase [bacterium]